MQHFTILIHLLTSCLPIFYVVAVALFTMRWVLMQASFLSMNLHAVAENFETLDLSKRLFIEPDLLPPELVCLLSKLILKIM